MEKWHKFYQWVRDGIIHAFKQKKINPLLGIAIFMGVLVSWEARNFWREHQVDINEPRFLVAIRDLPAGHPMVLADYQIVPSSLISQRVEGHAVNDQELHRLKGAKLTSSIAQGKVLTARMLELPRRKTFADHIPQGARAYFVEAANAEYLSPGTRVDIVLRPQAKGAPAVTILDNLLVLDAEERRDRPGATLAVSPDDIELLEKALLQGKLSLALRNPEERPSRSKSKKRWNPAQRAKSGIQIITEAR